MGSYNFQPDKVLSDSQRENKHNFKQMWYCYLITCAILPCLKQGNWTAKDSGWPSSLTITLSRNQPQPPPRPSWPTRTLRTWPTMTDSMRNSSCWGKTERKLRKNVCNTQNFYLFTHSFLNNNSLTFPFSNLLTLFLLINMRRSPVSPKSPIILRKTLASVPLPLTLPVQIVTRYFITEERKREESTLSSKIPSGHTWCPDDYKSTFTVTVLICILANVLFLTR